MSKITFILIVGFFFINYLTLTKLRLFTNFRFLKIVNERIFIFGILLICKFLSNENKI